jgi:hypothetical protein
MTALAGCAFPWMIGSIQSTHRPFPPFASFFTKPAASQASLICSQGCLVLADAGLVAALGAETVLGADCANETAGENGENIGENAAKIKAARA